MPQLDILSYFSQFIFLLASFLSIYYFVIIYILPSTLTAGKLRAKFNSHLANSLNDLSISDDLEKQIEASESSLDDLTGLVLKELAHKNIVTSTVEDFNTIHKNGKYTMTSTLMFHYMNLLASKKRLVSSELTLV